MIAVILAGGRGTRISHLYPDVPKSLIPIAGKRFIDWQRMYLAHQGVAQVRLCIGHYGDQIARHLQGTDVRLYWDGATALGTGGAVTMAALGISEPFAVMYGDVLPLMANLNDMAAALDASGASACMAVSPNSAGHELGNVAWRSRTLISYKKSNVSTGDFIDYGVAVFAEFSVISSFAPTPPWDLSRLYEKLADTGGLIGYSVTDTPIEVGSQAGISAASISLDSFHYSDLPERAPYIWASGAGNERWPRYARFPRTSCI